MAGNDPFEVPADASPSTLIGHPGSAHVAQRAQRLSQIAGFFGGATALTVLAGWWLDVPSLRRILPGQPPMVVLTAIATLLLSAALLFSADSKHRLLHRDAWRWLAGAAAALSVGGGLQYVLPLGFRLDDWVQRLVFGPLQPGSGMALATVGNILGTATGLLLRDADDRRLRRGGELVALGAFIIAAVGVLGYAYSVGAFQREGPFSRMALVTAMALGILSAGVLLSRPDRPWVIAILGGGEASALTWHLLPTVVALPLVLGWLGVQAIRSSFLQAETSVALLVIVLVLWLAGLSLRLARNVERRAVAERIMRENLQHNAKRQEVLVNELQHRTRNLLAVVAAVANQTVKRGGSLAAFEDRLQALGRAQGLLSQGGGDVAEIGALVHAELAAYIEGAPDRVTISGPTVHLTARQVQNFALAVHELTTNAVKYGALRGDAGRLAVTWDFVLDRRQRRRLALTWVESGFTIDPQSVTRRGYGTDLIQRALAYALQAEVDYTLGTDGVRCRVEMPIS